MPSLSAIDAIKPSIRYLESFNRSTKENNQSGKLFPALFFQFLYTKSSEHEILQSFSFLYRYVDFRSTVLIWVLPTLYERFIHIDKPVPFHHPEPKVIVLGSFQFIFKNSDIFKYLFWDEQSTAIQK